jgi:hypothetical protein
MHANVVKFNLASKNVALLCDLDLMLGLHAIMLLHKGGMFSYLM